MKVTEGEFMTCFRQNVCAIVSERLEQKVSNCFSLCIYHKTFSLFADTIIPKLRNNFIKTLLFKKLSD